MPAAISFLMGQSPASGSKPDHDYGNEGNSDAAVGTIASIILTDPSSLRHGTSETIRSCVEVVDRRFHAAHLYLFARPSDLRNACPAEHWQ